MRLKRVKVKDRHHFALHFSPFDLLLWQIQAIMCQNIYQRMP